MEKRLLLPIYGEVARRAGGDEGEARPDAPIEGRGPSPPHSWGGGPEGRRGPGNLPEQPASLRAPPVRRPRSPAAARGTRRCPAISRRGAGWAPGGDRGRPRSWRTESASGLDAGRAQARAPPRG